MNGSRAATISCQRLNLLPCYAAQSIGIPKSGGPREGGPADRTEWFFPHVARRRECRRDETNLRAGAPGAVIRCRVVHRTGNQACRQPHKIRPLSIAQMNASFQATGQSGVFGDHHAQAPGAAKPRDLGRERRAAGCFVVAENNAAEAARQACYGRQRVRQPRVIRE